MAARMRMHGLKISSRAIMDEADSLQYHVLANDKLDDIEMEAKSIFRVRRKYATGRNDSETSPPIYLQSFRRKKMAKSWRLINVDPGAMWVEFGAHAGGKTFVLGYRPMGTALDIVAAQNG